MKMPLPLIVWGPEVLIYIDIRHSILFFESGTLSVRMLFGWIQSDGMMPIWRTIQLSKKFSVSSMKMNSSMSKVFSSILCCPSYGFTANSIFNPRKFSLPFILSFDFTNRYCHISAILWTVAPNVRKDALLMKQARLIDLFRFGQPF